MRRARALRRGSGRRRGEHLHAEQPADDTRAISIAQPTCSSALPGDRISFGDMISFGDRISFGDMISFGDWISFGEAQRCERMAAEHIIAVIVEHRLLALPKNACSNSCSLGSMLL